MADYREVTACRLCDSTELASVLDLGRTPLANELDGTELFPLVVNRCGSCGHHQLSIAVSPERLWGPSYPYQSGTSPVFRKHLEMLADEVAWFKPGGRVLEIASNDGTLVRMLAERGLTVNGFDPSGPDEYRNVGTGCYYLCPEGWPGAPSWVHGTRDQDVILALNVFAHVDDLHSFTAAVKEALAPDGVFIVEVCRDWDENFDTVYHEHMSYHDGTSAKMFFARHGLKVQRIQTVLSQGKSLRFYVEHKEPPYKNNTEHMAIRLEKSITQRCGALKFAMEKLSKRNETVCIYGAPAKLTTLLYAAGLQDFPFACVGDDNQRKVGRTTPGNHIPIVSVEEMLARKPDTILVASWNFFDDIRRKLRDAGFRGGIINPMGES